MKKEIVIKEALNHKKYRWPLTLVSYPIVFGKENVREGMWTLLDERGEPVEFQVGDAVMEGEFVRSLKLYFLCSLEPGECRRYSFCCGEDMPDLAYGRSPSGFEADSPEAFEEQAFLFEADEAGKGFCIRSGAQRIVCRPGLDSIMFRDGEKGPLFQDVEAVCRGGRGEEYTLKVRRIRGMPFFELSEEMKGFTDERSMEMSFESFDFTHRYSWQRPVEKIDAYLRENGEIPVTVMPFENWNPWFQSKYIAFLGEERSAGIFIRDNLGWDDGRYPIWGSYRDFGITFTPGREHVDAHFPLKNGKRFTGVAFMGESNPAYIEYLWLWYAFLHLDKIKDWILDWKEDQKQYPRFFDKKYALKMDKEVAFCQRGERIPAERMRQVVDELSESMNWPEDLNPVGNREFADWTVLFDLTADEMSREEFDHVRAAFAFMAYATMDENYMPTENMLAGHPNFLCDTAAVAGFVAALFPGHPHNGLFRDYFCRTIEKNLKYHIRPDVEAYGSLGGRATENLGCYHFAALRPTMRVCMLFAAWGWPVPLNNRQGAKWLNWMTNCLSAPVDGRRILPPQGAHACKYADGFLEIPYIMYLFAKLLLKDYPKEAQNALVACEGSCLNSLEYRQTEDDIWRTLLVRENVTYPLHLVSEKFTGYGYILREGVGTPEEISVHVQQLDQGPHYRWGTFNNTGNGGIYYYAAGKRYSFNSLEDTGDRNLGAEEGNCGFSVLRAHTYHNIGFHDLTEPLYDFSVVKQVKLPAEENISRYYRYRKVSLVETDYIVLYDAVTHMRARGRFTWTVNEREDFPGIYQIKPGVPGKACVVRGAADVAGDDGLTSPDAAYRSKSLSFDGDGDFLTIVSHRQDLQAHPTEYGAMVEMPERRDYVFEDGAWSRVEREGIRFQGYSGILSVRADGGVRGALLDGEMLSCDSVCVEIPDYHRDMRCAVSFEDKAGKLNGEIITENDVTVNLNGRVFSLKKGRYVWKRENGHKQREIVVSRKKERSYDPDPGFVRDTRRHEFGFYGTDFWDPGEILYYPKREKE